MTEGPKERVILRDCRVAALLAMTQSPLIFTMHIYCFQATLNVIASEAKQSPRLLFTLKPNPVTLLRALWPLRFSCSKPVPLLRTLMLSDSLVQSPCPVSRYFLLFFFPGSPNFSRRSNKISLNSAAFSNSNAREACCISFSKRTIISRASLAFIFENGVGVA